MAIHLLPGNTLLDVALVNYNCICLIGAFSDHIGNASQIRDGKGHGGANVGIIYRLHVSSLVVMRVLCLSL